MMRELADIIRSLKDPRIPQMTSVLRATVTPDLKYCKAHISVLGDSDVQKNCIKGLKSASGYIRREISRRVNLRITPEIQFVLDDSVAQGAQIAHLLKTLDITGESSDGDEPFDTSEGAEHDANDE